MNQSDLVPTSEQQSAATSEGQIPDFEWITDDTAVVALPLPPGNVPYTLCYLLIDGDGCGHLIDPGYDFGDNHERITAALATAAITTLASVIVTHLHPDHIGLAGRLRAETGAKIVMHRIEQQSLDGFAGRLENPAVAFARWKVPAGEQPILSPSQGDGWTGILDAPADVLVDDGVVLEIPGRAIRVIHTPGHTRGHISLRDDDLSLLFTGDHVLPMIYPGLGLGGPGSSNPLADYLVSLERLRAFDSDEVCPGHGYRFTGLPARIDQLRAHHLRRSAEVADILAESPQASVWTVASRITWTAGWANLSGFFAYSALSQTEMHIDYLTRKPFDAT